MRSAFSLAAVCGLALLTVAGSASAQLVAMSGEYHESNGFIVNIPNNQPIVYCGGDGQNITANENLPPTGNDARCHGVRRTIYRFTPGGGPGAPGAPFGPQLFLKPDDGVPNRTGAGFGTATSVMGGLNVGDPFTIPTSFFGQDPQTPPEAGAVINNAVIWISSQFTARMPAASRNVNPQASTRQMRAQLNLTSIPGQAARPLNPGNPETITINMNRLPGNPDIGAVVYQEGPNKFGGTMGALLDGTAGLWLKTTRFDANFPTAVTPVLGFQPVGDATVALNERNGVGWDYTIMGGQDAGLVYGPTGTGIVACDVDLPATPPNCNRPPDPVLAPVVNAPTLIVGTMGTTIMLPVSQQVLPAAVSTKNVFPFTTGNLSLWVDANRGAAGVFTETLTGMGYDTDTATPGVRNVGLVAGSYTNRDSGAGIQLASQLIGVDIRLAPEPGSAVALFAGVGLLGFAAARRRR